MSRPTPGREAPAPASCLDRTFPAVLASVLDRANGQVAAPAPAAVPTAVPAPEPAAAESSPAPSAAPWLTPVADPPGHGPGAAPAGAGAVAPPGPARMVLVSSRSGDTPETAEDHLIEVVDADAVPLWRAFLQRAGRAARQSLIEHYGPLVRGVGMKLAVRLPSSIELADLVQSGTFGLMEAIDRFDPARAVRFEGYAAQRVRGAMLDELRAQDWVPRTVRARSREVERAREAVQLRLGRAATDRELAAELRIGLRELRLATRPVHVISADRLDDDLPGGGGVADLLVDHGAPDPVLAAVHRETARELWAAVAQLGDRDRLVLHLYYLENRTLAEIGTVLGVTESRVCQLHGRMVARLRGRLEQSLAG
ncbi:FliA/WhiG family RNA polymerase sigma factor [Pseudonocardia sp. KRD291]|uniref:FliA/WhiG family RNA polymerase sigma factor n=1 Tax=Pseudonocardia sp. KRD291 TaxID=2792007 RepID=UPI001C4A136E|nr:FliA/WhiG family RNA polymerase sigma factor [Pseudonocardia sp. KRD291]MBW0105895.1 FliA/WhiG family RNA polymerase sigma factor [Pseudonocardia sp. KRD291]